MTTPNRPSEQPANSEEMWDAVAQSSWESFPASDPPSWVGWGSKTEKSDKVSRRSDR